MKFITYIIATIVAATLLFSGFALASGVDVLEDSCAESGSISALCESDDSLFGQDSIFQRITNAFLFVVGALSVIMIVVGGFRYAVSGGDQSSITAAKNTILYAIVGLVVALSAYAIVNFILIYV